MPNILDTLCDATGGKYAIVTLSDGTRMVRVELPTGDVLVGRGAFVHDCVAALTPKFEALQPLLTLSPATPDA